ncbi:thermonuclease family protein [Virgibacillus sp. AGTR]|uniref:thermonuclease family protein n=1 Tax=Virgibacillus sp. AGTR TaxID=2812055 RepID=UPI001D168EC0|nr:thermonuclease family protein [Virgibacillus sp. AGTR]MCC2248994.1 thermonuclease family protein [Virgibacillus sp. AGTR]
MRELRKVNKKRLWITGMLVAVFMIAGCGKSEISKSDSQAEAEPRPETDSTKNNENKEQTPLDKLKEITEEVTVSRVVDGDTIVVENKDGEEETVELLLIDTPENGPDDMESSQQFGLQATKIAKNNLEGYTVNLERGNPGKDDQGHTLGYIWLFDNGGPFNYAELPLSKGLAKVKNDAPSDAKYLDKFREYEQRAKDEAQEKKEEVGDFPHNIWSVEGYVTDEGFNQSLDF